MLGCVVYHAVGVPPRAARDRLAAHREERGNAGMSGGSTPGPCPEAPSEPAVRSGAAPWVWRRRLRGLWLRCAALAAGIAISAVLGEGAVRALGLVSEP